MRHILTSFILQDYDRADDCFAEIMNDDIIKLDQTLLDDPQFPFTVPDKTKLERGSEPPNPVVETTQGPPFQGTANRRIRLKKPYPSRRISYPTQYMSSKKPPKYPMKSLFNRLIYLLVIILTLLVLFQWLGGSPQLVKKVTHTALYHDF